MAYSDKVLDHYENPRNVGSFAKDADDVGTGMVGAPACGDVMKLQISRRRRRSHRGRQVQDLWLRLRDRIVVAGDRMGQGQDARSGADDQEHAHCRGAGASAGEDPLLDSGRGRDQGRGRRLQAEARRNCRSRRGVGGERDRACRHCRGCLIRRWRYRSPRLRQATSRSS